MAPHIITKQPLAPYYPAAFTPAYLSLMCRDEHGRKPVRNTNVSVRCCHCIHTFCISLLYCLMHCRYVLRFMEFDLMYKPSLI